MKRRISESNPAFANQPFDASCRECDFGGAMYTCADLARAAKIVRVSGAAQQPGDGDCWDNNGHEIEASCWARVTLTFEKAETLYPQPSSRPLDPVSAMFWYVTFASDSRVPVFLDPGASYYVFLKSMVTTSARGLPQETWQVLGSCPRSRHTPKYSYR